ncbi:TonB-dependent receptor [Fulvivirgaceae bacterium BMA12]|uniref:TonB-dependent receptor n=1 Tax=Agaribacillus aureus TaxID=3051825 RepID=A0ABT8L4S8_9BACT|nr:TonB-dependent receptor [Fulvivirgaceae bacterium BMA12]
MKLKLLQEIIMFSKYVAYGVLIQIFFLNILIAADLNAQKVKSVKTLRAELTQKAMPLKSIFREIEKETGLIFSYDENELGRKLGKEVILKERNATVAMILTDISRQENLKFKQVNRNISVKKIPKRETDENPSIEVLINEILVRGKITGENNEPLPGVNVLVKGSSLGTVADVNGEYQINVPGENSILVFSFIGYEPIEEVVGQRTVIDVSLRIDTKALEEVVVVGYGTVKKSDLTGSVASIKGESVKEFPVTSVDQAIQSRAPGVQVTQASSAPGGGVSVRIRGSNSINSGSEPLYVIDGFPIYPNNGVYGTDDADSGINGSRRPGNVLASINPNDIESIEILKDASGTAIYGSRGSNGVVLITTKRGKSGESRIDYDGSVSFQSIANKIDRLNGREFATYLNTLEESQGGAPIYTPAEIDAIGEGTDWLDEILQTGMIHNHQLSFSGGSEKTRYALIGNFHQNEGIIKETDFRRFGIRLNLDNQVLNDRLTISSSWSFNRTTSNNAPTDRGGPGGIIITALGLDPTIPVRNADGEFNLASYDGRFFINPVQELNFVTDQDFTNRVLGNTGFTFKLLEGLNFKTSIGADLLNANRITFFPVNNTRLGREREGEITNASRNSANILNENILSFNKQLHPDHFIDVVAGYTFQKEVNRFSIASTRGIPAATPDQATLQGGANVQIPNSNRREWILKSYLGRVNYNFKERYLFTFTFRRDGSSRFGEENKWANFPSFALGWRIIEEDFFQSSGLSNTISDLKLRTSWGITGNSELPVFNSLPNLNEYNYVFGGQLILGLADERLGNSDLKWETTKMFNIGLDISLLENRLTLNADYFFNKTEDLLLKVSIPPSLGFEEVLKNSGSLENKGFELGLNYVVLDRQDLKWDVSGNVSVLRNEITDLGSSTPFFSNSTSGHLGVDGSWVEAGNPIGVWRGYKYTGIFQSQEEIDTNPSRSGDKPGYPRYQDTDGNGEITPDDFVILGDPNPDFTWGLNSTLRYKNFDFSFFFRGVHGNDVRNLQASELGDGVQKINQLSNILTDSWSPSNTGASRAIIDANRDFANSYRDSDFFIEDGSFIRLQNVLIGYSLPTNSTFIRNARVYISAQNPFVITDYSGFDPEVNNQGQANLNRADDYDAYPRARIFTVGVNLGL